MIQRHPRFGDVKADTSAEVLVNWEQIKKEKGAKTQTDILKAFPEPAALMRAYKVQQKAPRLV